MRRPLVILLIDCKKGLDEFVGRELAIEAEHCLSFRCTRAQHGWWLGME